MLDTIVKILTIIHHLIWIIIGLILLSGIYLFFVFRPDKMLKTGSTMFEGMKFVEKLMQSETSETPIPSKGNLLISEQINCLKTTLGSNRLNDIQQGATLSSDEQGKLLQCFQTGTR